MAKIDRWPALCDLYKRDDGLPVRSDGVGSWTEDKIHYWNRYIDITTSAMCESPMWPEGVVYVDLFAGPGVCSIPGTSRRFPGSALVAAHAPKQFRKLIAAELEPVNANALQQRLAQTPSADRSVVIEGDCHRNINTIVSHIPPRSLCLAFIDPTNLNVPFETVAALANRGATDLLILFADRLDIVRNVDLYEQQESSNLDRLLGSNAWRQRWPSVANRTMENICEFFAGEYEAQLRTRLGYRHFGRKSLKNRSGHLYSIIYATKNPRGLDFWDKATQKDRGGQSQLF